MSLLFGLVMGAINPVYEARAALEHAIYIEKEASPIQKTIPPGKTEYSHNIKAKNAETLHRARTHPIKDDILIVLTKEFEEAVAHYDYLYDCLGDEDQIIKYKFVDSFQVM